MVICLLIINMEFKSLTERETYFDMGLYPLSQQRLKLFWSVLGECIEERKTFSFQCIEQEEADEFKKLTYTLVFQINDIWKVTLDEDLIVKAIPPNKTT